ncbi:response regulator receiver modulated diguanylate cyclase/phosphodiesterase with PAS/PAC sensor(s) [Solidesulfovibrio fructosivorans JJ]]|uniref:Response regulator receiver modulated diguanylate cyclase/phosphodiesterase with PAS/PAC sensor(S) n=1 Tax=Solidesulfovibrio fructosivorans JJ] TaxID=596151 RepID=E1K1M0_SOLFR|nr:EAL domain-containing protein [Solidesulfovibrio fructosivorans]EFL49514.1 response regulator receiver modulated diguanylate cyclase/phosphodiesterase with PAS/PAC sensor(s) [Solidesulfovibrio fructosivorans JJ]]
MAPPRILIGEQDRVAAACLAALLDKNGYVPLGPTASCRETLEKADDDRPDLAVLRLDLEGACDGADAAALLREGHGIPVILLARNGDACPLDPARRAQVNFLLPHPPDDQTLLAAVETSLARQRLEKALAAGQAQSRAVFAAATTAQFLLDARGLVREANPAGEKLFDRAPGTLPGVAFATLFAPEDRPRLDRLLPAALGGETARARVRGRLPGGGTIPLAVTCVPLPAGEGPRFLLEASPTRAPGARPDQPDLELERCPEGFFVLDAEDRLLAANAAAWGIFGLCAPPPHGALVTKTLPEELATALSRDAGRVIAWNEPVRKEVTVSIDGADKTLLLALFPMGHDEGSRLAGGLVTDITDRKRLESQLAHMAFHDPLTGLPNRSLCLDRIRQAIERSKRRDNYQYAVIFLDLDRFKVINDSLGHHMGDRLLEGVSKRLRECVRGLDTVSRLGGDEFVVLLEETGSYREIVRIVKRIRSAVGEVFQFCDHDIHVTCSMGIVISPCLYDKPEELLRNANIALHRAKGEGRNRFKVFNTRMLEDAIRLMDLESALRLALDRGEFFLDYQPILSLSDRSLQGFEALVRWRRPGKGVASPKDFIPVAEDTGLIVPLGLWVLEEACRTMVRWQTDFPQVLAMSMSVNLSAKQLTQPTLVEDVERILRATGLDPHALKLEITETVIMDNPEVSILRLKRLKALGVRLSVDDFGTGYSSLSYLQRFPIDTLKVDRTFVSEIEANENRKIVGAVVALAHSLGLDVVAEGVELEAQSAVLTDFACEAGQGFLFSRPIAREDVERMLDSGGCALGQAEP